MKLTLRPKEIGIVVFIMLACIVSVIFVNQAFANEEGDHRADVQDFDTAHMKEGYIQVDVHLLEVNAVHEHLVVELIFTPHGRFDAGEGVLSTSLEVDVSSTDADSILFEAGKRMSPHELTVDFYEGEANLYPFDRHKALFEILVLDASLQTSVPMQLDFFGYHHGFAVEDVPLPPNEKGYLGFDVYVERSTITLWTAVFIMAIMWGLTIVNLFLLWAVLTDRMPMDLGLFGYMSGFLVAMYFFRSIFPDIPPFLGVYADYLALFWVELVTAIISIVLAAKWFMDLSVQKIEEKQPKQ